ncbi:uncharacterized protein LAJ45_01417 [Morchella importuna]|uniref:uncharacterized protein n=1 Tax=Morchella importuna TaxID=1174673 RepID=UPI001E8CBACD|nr:uncharacterized protein LAJ45_01417 [Morchella importuna]KAH8154885.1 hypothetical protein LAJ45_01417 [Morchella importuna]
MYNYMKLKHTEGRRLCMNVSVEMGPSTATKHRHLFALVEQQTCLSPEDTVMESGRIWADATPTIFYFDVDGCAQSPDYM